MLRALVSASLRLRLLIVAGAALLVFLGARSTREIPIDVFPEFAPPLVEVQTEAPGLSTEEVDALVTLPLESALNGSPWVRTVRSKSVQGLSSVVLIFEEGTDLLEARQFVGERLSHAAAGLPAVAKPPVLLSPLSALSRVLKIGVSSDELSLLELSDLVRWTIRPRLLSIPGVANVAAWGERARNLQVLLDPAELRAQGVALSDVLATVQGATKPTTGGFVDTPNQRLAVVAETGVRTADELAAVVLQAPAGTNPSPATGVATRRLGDVADIVEGHAPLIGEGYVDDGPGLLLIVEKQPWANTLEVTRRVEEAIDTLRPALGPVQIDTTIFRPATFVEMSIRNLSLALLLGAVMVIIVLYSFSLDWRSAFISMTALPISLLAAVLTLRFLGETVNTMILAGLTIALGEVVDDAIIDVENIARRLRQNEGRKSAFRVVLEASLEVRSAVIFGSLIVCLVMLPVFFLEGLAGTFFRPLASAYVLAMSASLLTALTVTPALSLMLLGPRATRAPHRGVRLLDRAYMALLKRACARPVRLGAAALTVLAVTAAAVPRLGEAFLPSFKEYDFLMHWVAKPGASVEAMTRITGRVSEELRAIPGVRNFGAHIGRAEVADEVVGANFAELWISVDPDVDYQPTVERIQDVVNGYPGLYRDVLTYLRERIKEVLTGTSGSIVVRIFGPDLGVLRGEAERVSRELESVDGIADLSPEQQVLVPQVKIELTPEALAAHGLTPGAVQQSLSVFIQGKVAGEIFEQQRSREVVVWGLPQVRQDVASLREIEIELPGGGAVRLGELAVIEIVPAPNVIKREASSRKIDVVANAAGQDIGSVTRDVEQRVASLAFPQGYHAEVLGEFAAQRAARQRLIGLCLISLVAVFLLVQTELGSWIASLLLVGSLPFALVGGVAALFVTGSVLSLGAMIGSFALLGIAARNGIMLFSHCRHLQLEEGVPFGPELVRRAARERLAPILMTALTTGFALVPVALGGARPGYEIEHPMAVVILGGLVTTTFSSLLLLPALCSRFGRAARASAD